MFSGVKAKKRYFYKGKEISRAKVNAMIFGAAAGMVGGAFGLWILSIVVSALLSAIGGAA